ncbi:hypothetical protein Hanom_Chr08g00743141 [Helianthus anomalus]
MNHRIKNNFFLSFFTQRASILLSASGLQYFEPALTDVTNVYILLSKIVSKKSILKHNDDLVLCRVFCKNRETTDEKQNNLGSINKYRSHEDTIKCSSSLPPLMEPYSLSFDQSQHAYNNNNNIFNQQVPCFSTIFNQYNPRCDLINNHHVFTTIVPPPQQPPNLTISSPSSSSSSHCGGKKDVIKAVLNRFNDAAFSFGEENSDQSFLSDVDLPVTMWHP